MPSDAVFRFWPKADIDEHGLLQRIVFLQLEPGEPALRPYLPVTELNTK